MEAGKSWERAYVTALGPAVSSRKTLVGYSPFAMSKQSAKLPGSQGTGYCLVIWCNNYNAVACVPKDNVTDCVNAHFRAVGTQLLNLE